MTEGTPTHVPGEFIPDNGLVGEMLHTAFRKGPMGTTNHAHQIWSLIRDMPPDEWGRVTEFVRYSLNHHFGEQQAELERLREAL